MAIAVIIITAYLYYRNISYWSSLVSIGLISFVSVIQFLPALIGGLFWKQAGRKGALAGMIAGFLIWTYTLILPSLASRGIIDQAWLAEGPWGFSWLKPDALFGLTGYSAISHSLIWSLTFNLLLFVGISLFSEQSLEERNQAKLFVDVQDYLKQQLNPNEWQGNASVAEVRTLLQNFMGSEKAAQALNVFARRNQLDLEHNQFADSRLLAFAERILAGTLGSASARILLE
jgi:Na+/proline symporter